MNFSSTEISKSRILAGTILAACLVFGFTFTASLIDLIAPGQISDHLLFWISRFAFWVCLSLILVWSLRIEKSPILLWKERPLSIPEMLATYFGLFGAVMIGLLLLAMTLLLTGYKEDNSHLAEMLNTFRKDPTLLVFTVVTAGVVEELIFRGYLLPRLTILLKSKIAAILISSLLFGLLHFGYGTIAQIIGPFWIGLVFAAYYTEYRNIKALIIFHTVWDLGALLLQLLVRK